MKRTTSCVLVMVGLGWLLTVVPAWADHSRSTGINCSSFAFQEDAQAYFNLHPGDPEGLDGPIGPASSGIPGVACEDLPRRGSSATTTTSTVPATTTTVVVTNTTAVPVATGGSTASGGGSIQATTTVAPTTTTTVRAAVASEGRALALTG